MCFGGGSSKKKETPAPTPPPESVTNTAPAPSSPSYSVSRSPNGVQDIVTEGASQSDAAMKRRMGKRRLRIRTKGGGANVTGETGGSGSGLNIPKG